MDTNHSVLRFAKRFFAGTLLSRLGGVGREMAMAFCFGSAPEIAAFIVSYRLANLFRRLFGDGNLQAGFTPRFEAIYGQNPKEAYCFYRDASFSLALFLLGLTVLMGGVFWGCGRLWSGWAEITHLALWMMPGLIFICLHAFNSAFLQCHKSYFIPAATPILFNIVWIAAALFASQFPLLIAARILSFGVTIAFALQWLGTAIQVRKKLSAHLTWTQWFRPKFFSSEWRQLIKPLGLGAIGIGAIQINSVLDAIIARLADPSGPLYLWYAIRIQQLPLALFGIALAGALLPPLSRAMREGAADRYRSLLETALRHSAALIVPCAFGLLALGGCGLNLLYGHGQFHPKDVQSTMYCLWGYGIGLVPSVLILLLASGFYARRSYFIPTLSCLLSVALNVTLNLLMVFLFHWGTVSIAIGTSVAALFNCLLLWAGLQQNCGKILFWKFLGKISFCATIATALTLIFGIYLGDGTFTGEFTRSPQLQLIQFLSMGALFLASFLSLAYLMRIKEFFDLLRIREQEYN